MILYLLIPIWKICWFSAYISCSLILNVVKHRSLAVYNKIYIIYTRVDTLIFIYIKLLPPPPHTRERFCAADCFCSHVLYTLFGVSHVRYPSKPPGFNNLTFNYINRNFVEEVSWQLANFSCETFSRSYLDVTNWMLNWVCTQVNLCY